MCGFSILKHFFRTPSAVIFLLVCRSVFLFFALHVQSRGACCALYVKWRKNPEYENSSRKCRKSMEINPETFMSL